MSGSATWSSAAREWWKQLAPQFSAEEQSAVEAAAEALCNANPVGFTRSVTAANVTDAVRQVQQRRKEQSK